VSATDKLQYVATDVVGGPAYVVASVVGAVGLAVGGSIVLVAACSRSAGTRRTSSVEGSRCAQPVSAGQCGGSP
jgi:hypothetical protein